MLARKIAGGLLLLGLLFAVGSARATNGEEGEGATGGAAAASEAASVDPSSWGYALAHELMSPFCPGRTLAACTSPQAGELRQWILLQEAAGASREETLQILYERFGDVIRSSPRPEGWGLAAHLLPYAALALGAVFVAFVLRRIVKRPAAVEPASAAPAPVARVTTESDAELARRIEEEMRASEV